METDPTVSDGNVLVTAAVRRVLVRRFPYGLYYRNHRDHIEIIGCRHQRRRLPAR